MLSVMFPLGSFFFHQKYKFWDYWLEIVAQCLEYGTNTYILVEVIPGYVIFPSSDSGSNSQFSSTIDLDLMILVYWSVLKHLRVFPPGKQFGKEGKQGIENSVMCGFFMFLMWTKETEKPWCREK